MAVELQLARTRAFLEVEVVLEMANLSRHHVGRELAMFESAGWIAGGYNRIRLLDPAGLADFAFDDEDG